MYVFILYVFPLSVSKGLITVCDSKTYKKQKYEPSLSFALRLSKGLMAKSMLYFAHCINFPLKRFSHVVP